MIMALAPFFWPFHQSLTNTAFEAWTTSHQKQTSSASVDLLDSFILEEVKQKSKKDLMGDLPEELNKWQDGSRYLLHITETIGLSKRIVYKLLEHCLHYSNCDPLLKR